MLNHLGHVIYYIIYYVIGYVITVGYESYGGNKSYWIYNQNLLELAYLVYKEPFAP